MKRVIISLVLILLLSGCIPPLTKESYLIQYEHFISQVRENRSNPSFSWEKNDKEFEKFSQTYYQRFENELSFSEKVLCQRYRLDYLFMRTQDELRSTVENVFYDDLKKMQDKIENYIENDLTRDFQSLIKEVENITNSAFDTLKQAFRTVKENGSATPP